MWTSTTPETGAPWWPSAGRATRSRPRRTELGPKSSSRVLEKALEPTHRTGTRCRSLESHDWTWTMTDIADVIADLPDKSLLVLDDDAPLRMRLGRALESR